MSQHMAARSRQSFFNHVQELRNRLLLCALTFLLGAVAGYLLRETLLRWLVMPLNQPLYYTSPVGGFSFTLSLSLFFGLLLVVPFLIFHLIKFLEPISERPLGRLAFLFLFISSLLAAAGIVFAYFISLPAALRFLSEFNTEQIRSLISTDAYFSFVVVYLAGFALIFQVPLILTTIDRLIYIPIKVLMRAQGFVVLISFIIAAIITPTPDPVNQVFMALPVILLFYLSVGLIAWRHGKNARAFRKLLPVPLPPAPPPPPAPDAFQLSARLYLTDIRRPQKVPTKKKN